MDYPVRLALQPYSKYFVYRKVRILGLWYVAYTWYGMLRRIL